MKLEDQVVSLELAKKLKELGVKQESLFYYFSADDDPNDTWISYIGEIDEITDGNDYSAFTVAELGDMLGKEYRDKSVAFKYSPDNEAETRAWTLIHLIEEGIIEIQKYTRGVTIVINRDEQ